MNLSYLHFRICDIFRKNCFATNCSLPYLADGLPPMPFLEKLLNQRIDAAAGGALVVAVLDKRERGVSVAALVVVYRRGENAGGGLA